MMAEISVDQDEKNKSLIAYSLRQAFGLSLTPKQRWLLSNNASPVERAAYVKKKSVTLLIVIGILTTFVVWSSLQPQPPKPIPTFEAVGNVQQIQLHDTTFSTSTTVVTPVGTFQVHGAVSATMGDQATMKTIPGTGYGNGKYLCVDSRIKSDCYRLM